MTVVRSPELPPVVLALLAAWMIAYGMLEHRFTDFWHEPGFYRTRPQPAVLPDPPLEEEEP